MKSMKVGERERKFQTVNERETLKPMDKGM